MAKKTSPWIAHVKAVAKKQGITYPEALKVAAKTYKKIGKQMKNTKEDKQSLTSNDF